VELSHASHSFLLTQLIKRNFAVSLLAIENTILFVGATGVGKSYLCNRIFEMYNSPSRFESGASLTAVTGTLQQGRVAFEGRQFTIVDSPGFFDTKQDDSTPESTAKTDGENMCKFARALEDCKNIYGIVFVFDGRLSTPHKMYEVILIPILIIGFKCNFNIIINLV